MPSSLYAAQDGTIDRLHQNMAEDLTKLFNEGIEIEATPRHLSPSPKPYKPNLGNTISSWPVKLSASEYQVEGVGTKRFWVAIAGIKGDWPYLRKAMGLAVGFASRRKCHICPGDEPFILYGNVLF